MESLLHLSELSLCVRRYGIRDVAPGVTFGEGKPEMVESGDVNHMILNLVETMKKER